MASTHSSSALRCRDCAAEIEDAPVRVEEQYREITHTYEGHAVETELRPSFAGVYCSLVCAAANLGAEHERRGRLASLRRASDAR